MKVAYTKHAQEMMVFRNIKSSQIEICIKNPDYIISVREERKAYIKLLGKSYLKIIVFQEEMKIVIVTAYWIAKKRFRQ